MMTLFSQRRFVMEHT